MSECERDLCFVSSASDAASSFDDHFKLSIFTSSENMRRQGVRKFQFLVGCILISTCIVVEDRVASAKNKTKINSDFSGKATKISRDRAVQIATDRAIEDQFGMFKQPYVDSIYQFKENGNWQVKILSRKPDPTMLGEMYMVITIDGTSGKIISVRSGGGS